MDGFCYPRTTSVDPSVYFMMDNDSGYVSNNLDQETNSDSILDNSTSTVDILRSFLPKPVYLSEDALLECPHIQQKYDTNVDNYSNDSLSTVINSSVQDEKSYPNFPSFSSFQTDTDASDTSIIPIADPIYFDLNALSSPSTDKPKENLNDVHLMQSIEDQHKLIDSILQKEPDRFLTETPENNINDTDLMQSIHCNHHKLIDPILQKELNSSLAETPEENIKDTHLMQSTHTHDKLNSILQKESSSSLAETPENNVKDTHLMQSIHKHDTLINSMPQIEPDSIPTQTPKENINDTHLMQSILTHDKLTSSIQQIESDKVIEQATIVAINAQPRNECPSNNEKSKVFTPNKMKFHSSSDNNILANVTNICDKLTHQAESSLKNINNRRRCASTSKDKENISNEVPKTPNRGVKRKFIETGSPDLFSDDDNCTAKQLLSPRIIEERFVHKLDHKLLKRVQKETSGVPPPPDFTITQFTVDDILQKLKTNKEYFWTTELNTSNNDIANSSNESKNSSFGSVSSILIDGNFEEAVNKGFPQILHSRHHGLHHNRNKLSEEIEHLCDKYARRYIGIETQSTCCAIETKYMSPTKRKVKQKWVTKSPGRRLSHLARRRITFSSANLHVAGSSITTSRARQILIDYKKLELLNHKKSPRKSPRKTPRKSPNKSPNQGRTPSSSAKKKLRMRFRLLSGDFKEGTAGPSSSIQGSKRALFQSPDSQNKYENILSNSSASSCSSFNNDLNNRGINTKRSLFSSPNRIGFKSSLFSSPNKKAEFKNISNFEKKRKRDETDENSSVPAKVFRSHSIDSRCSSNEFLFQSMPSKAKNENSQCSQPGLDLSAAHKKKLQWAVYESLKHHNITTSHPQFKIFASVLARVTRRFILSSNIRLEGGTSERMFRIAKHHSYAVVKGRSVEEIMSEYNRNKAKSLKPQGYIAPEDYLQCQNKSNSSQRDSVLKDRINIDDSNKNSNPRGGSLKVESRIDRIRKVINFEDSR